MTESINNDIINYAKGNAFSTDKSSAGYTITPEILESELSKSEVGRETLDYIKSGRVNVTLVYEAQYHTNRGEQQGNSIRIFMSNIGGNSLIAAQTVAHEVCHHKYGIGRSQWAEAVCMCKEKMLKENRTWLTFAEKRKIVSLAKQFYPEFHWRKGGYVNGRKTN